MAQIWIDAHGHFAAPGPALPRNSGPGTEAGGAWVFTVETSLAYMDRTGVAAQLISNCSPITKTEPIVASNTYGATIVKAYPKRFGLMAMLPLADPARAVAEFAAPSRSSGRKASRRSAISTASILAIRASSPSGPSSTGTARRSSSIRRRAAMVILPSAAPAP
jgi:hypothetical protein